jgi:phosphoglycolate phosphatase-like HAD superfamily hydrolase
MRALKQTIKILITMFALALSQSLAAADARDQLPSWNDGATKAAIVQFVHDVTRKNGKNFVPVSERIATFDNDGTLWLEQPMYVQLVFALDRVKRLAPEHPEWKEQEPFKSILAGNIPSALAGGKGPLLELIAATHAGMTPEEFDKIVADWLDTAKDSRFDCHYTNLVYKPMLELLAYMRHNDFKTYIVSGGGVEFMRVFSERVYGIPPEQVVGSSEKLKFELRDGKPNIIRESQIDFIDDKDGKPIGIQKFIGRKPIAAFGNSDGDLQMLQWTASGPGMRLCLYVHHTDGEREYAYDRQSIVGRLDKGLDEAAEKGWLIVDMKKDWKTVFPSK